MHIDIFCFWKDIMLSTLQVLNLYSFVGILGSSRAFIFFQNLESTKRKEKQEAEEKEFSELEKRYKELLAKRRATVQVVALFLYFNR